MELRLILMRTVWPERRGWRNGVGCLLGTALAFFVSASFAGTPKLETIARNLEARCQSGEFSGSVTVTVAETVVFQKFCGEADRSRHLPITAATRFKIFSVSKPITATVVGELIDQGKLRLNDHVAEYVTSLPRPWSDITVKQLLEHTSGIPDLTQQLLDYFLAHPSSSWDDAMRSVLTSASRKELEFVPGTKWSYNNFGYELLAVVAGSAARRPLEQLTDELFRKAGMHDAGLARPRARDNVLASAPVENLAVGYACKKEGGNPTTSYSFVQLGAGAVYASVQDLLQFDRALRQGVLLSPLLQEQSIKDAFPANENVGYGYGWLVRRVKDQVYVQHGGGNNGYVTEFARGTTQPVTVVIMSNDSCAPVGELRKEIMDAMLS